LYISYIHKINLDYKIKLSTILNHLKKIEIYTTGYCPFCIKAKSLLNKKKIKFYEIDVSNDESLREKMSVMANGARSVPQIFADNIHIGDCDKIHKLDQEKKLDVLLGLE